MLVTGNHKPQPGLKIKTENDSNIQDDTSQTETKNAPLGGKAKAISKYHVVVISKVFLSAILKMPTPNVLYVGRRPTLVLMTKRALPKWRNAMRSTSKLRGLKCLLPK
jgi:hypothetical protein